MEEDRRLRSLRHFIYGGICNFGWLNWQNQIVDRCTQGSILIVTNWLFELSSVFAESRNTSA